MCPGWGEEDGTPYWQVGPFFTFDFVEALPSLACLTLAVLAQVRNSWGTFFGHMGFFKLERGKDALYIENGDCW